MIAPMASRSLAAALATGALALAMPALAHHGFTGRYDISQPVWIEGEVVRVFIGQPHPTVTIRTSPNMAAPRQRPNLAGTSDVIGRRALVARPDTRGRDVRVEFPPVGVFFALDERVATGDRIAVIAFRNCLAPHQLRGQWVQPVRGAPVARAGRVQSQVDGC